MAWGWVLGSRLLQSLGLWAGDLQKTQDPLIREYTLDYEGLNNNIQEYTLNIIRALNVMI